MSRVREAQEERQGARRPVPKEAQMISDSKRRILVYLRKERARRRASISNALSMSESGISSNLRTMKKHGLVAVYDTRRWFITEFGLQKLKDWGI